MTTPTPYLPLETKFDVFPQVEAVLLPQPTGSSFLRYHLPRRLPEVHVRDGRDAIEQLCERFNLKPENFKPLGFRRISGPEDEMRFALFYRHQVCAWRDKAGVIRLFSPDWRPEQVADPAAERGYRTTYTAFWHPVTPVLEYELNGRYVLDLAEELCAQDKRYRPYATSCSQVQQKGKDYVRIQLYCTDQVVPVVEGSFSQDGRFQASGLTRETITVSAPCGRTAAHAAESYVRHREEEAARFVERLLPEGADVAVISRIEGTPLLYLDWRKGERVWQAQLPARYPIYLLDPQGSDQGTNALVVRVQWGYYPTVRCPNYLKGRLFGKYGYTVRALGEVVGRRVSVNDVER